MNIQDTIDKINLRKFNLSKQSEGIMSNRCEANTSSLSSVNLFDEDDFVIFTKPKIYYDPKFYKPKTNPKLEIRNKTNTVLNDVNQLLGDSKPTLQNSFRNLSTIDDNSKSFNLSETSVSSNKDLNPYKKLTFYNDNGNILNSKATKSKLTDDGKTLPIFEFKINSGKKSESRPNGLVESKNETGVSKSIVITEASNELINLNLAPFAPVEFADPPKSQVVQSSDTKKDEPKVELFKMSEYKKMLARDHPSFNLTDNQSLVESNNLHKAVQDLKVNDSQRNGTHSQETNKTPDANLSDGTTYSISSIEESELFFNQASNNNLLNEIENAASISKATIRPTGTDEIRENMRVRFSDSIIEKSKEEIISDTNSEANLKDSQKSITEDKTKVAASEIEEEKIKAKIGILKTKSYERTIVDFKKLHDAFTSNGKDKISSNTNESLSIQSSSMRDDSKINLDVDGKSNDSHVAFVKSTKRWKIIVAVIAVVAVILPIITTTAAILSIQTTRESTTSTQPTIKYVAAGTTKSIARSYSNNMVDLFTANAIKSSVLTLSVLGYTYQSLFGISYMSVNSKILYYVADTNTKTILVFDNNLVLSTYKPLLNGNLIECNQNTNEILITEPGFDLFKLDVNLTQTMGIGGCSGSSCNFRGMYHDSSHNLLYVADSLNNEIRVYDSNNYTFYKNISLGSDQPYALSMYNGFLYVLCVDKLVKMNSNGTIINKNSNICSNSKPTSCMHIDDYGHIAIPCHDNKSIVLYDSNMTYLANITTNQNPNCVTFDKFGRLLVTNNGGIDVYWY